MNEQLGERGQADVGFLNPLLYGIGSSKRYAKVFDDITEGKFSFPLIHAVRAAKDATLLTMLQQHTQDPALKQQAVAYMQDVTNSFAYTRDVWHALHTQTRTEIARLERTWGENQAMHRLLDALRIGA